MSTIDSTVSVVVPTFNGERFVESTLASVCQQLQPGDEVIVVDDASQDHTVSASRKFLTQECPVPWEVVEHPTNLGPPATRNTGIRQARGEVVMSVDQDDCWTPDHRSALLASLSGHHIVSGRARFHLSAELQRGQGDRWWRDHWLEEPQQLCEFGASAIRRECFEQIGLLDETFRFGGDDVEWFGRAQTRGLTRLETTNVVLDRTIHESNLSGNPRLRQELLDVVRHHLARGDE